MPGIAEELFVESDKLPIRLYCSICLDVAEAAIITQCDHLYCKECIQQLQDANGTDCECPNCRKAILPIQPALTARNFLSQQIVYCSEIEPFRCGWTGKYSMWHTHKAKYCKKASKSDKVSAKNASFTEFGNLSKDELSTMSVGRLKKILIEYLKLNRSKLSDIELSDQFNYKKFIEKSEYITAIIEFDSIYGVSAQYNNHSPSKHSKQSIDNANEFPTTYNALKRLKIRELSAYLRSKNIDPSSSEYNCIEKSDLINLVLRTQKHYRDIINGNAYDPKLEKQQFSPPPPSNPNPSMDIDNEEVKEENVQASSTAYHFDNAHLRRSSINRIDVNAVNNNAQNTNTNTTYSHVYTGNDAQRTNVNRNTLESNDGNYGPIPPSNENQRMYTEFETNPNANVNNYNNYSVHSHSHHTTYNNYYPSQSHAQPHTNANINANVNTNPNTYAQTHTNVNPNAHTHSPSHTHNFPPMPEMPQFPEWFGNVSMPNISNIYNNAMNTAHTAFANVPNDNDNR